MSDDRILETSTYTVRRVPNEIGRYKLGLPGVDKVFSELNVIAQDVKDDATSAMLSAASVSPEALGAAMIEKQSNSEPTRANNVVYISAPANQTLVPGG
jgi:hypothetical protein